MLFPAGERQLSAVPVVRGAGAWLSCCSAAQLPGFRGCGLVPQTPSVAPLKAEPEMSGLVGGPRKQSSRNEGGGAGATEMASQLILGQSPQRAEAGDT